jgi:dihydrolipoamide dehydrogenase
MKTNVDGIYAIGDITGKAQLAHVASEQGLVAAHNIAGQDKRMHYDVIPACIYTSPEIASVGITEAAAKEKGINAKTGSFLPAANGKSMIAGEPNGIVKVVTDADTGEILGAHLMCHRATDMIAEVCAAMRAEGTIEELSDTVHPHPTVSEMIMEAAHDVHAMCVHKV